MGNSQFGTSKPFQYTRLRPYDTMRQPLLDQNNQNMENTADMEYCKDKIEVLEKAVLQLKSDFSRMQTTFSKDLSVKAQNKQDTSILEKDIKTLKQRVALLESSPPMVLSEKTQDAATIQVNKRQNAVLEKKIMELTKAIQELKKSATCTNNSAEPCTEWITDPTNPMMNDLIGCLVVLIFLVAVLIGLNL